MKIRYVVTSTLLLGTLIFSGFSETVPTIVPVQSGEEVSLDSGIAVRTPEMPVVPSVAQAPIEPDLPSVTEEEPPSNDTAPVASPMPSSSPMMISGEVQPGWRPVPDPQNFPRNPFSGVAVAETPVAFRQEFDALAKNILGVLEIGDNAVLIVQNKVVRQGDEIKLMKEKSQTTTEQESAEAEMAALNAPVAIFSGVDKKKEVAKFLLGDTEVQVPIPSTRKKIANSNGDVQKLETMATATFLGEKGYFVVMSDIVPEVGPNKKVRLRTQFGIMEVKIVRKDIETNLALGQAVGSVSFSGLYKGIAWGKAPSDAQQKESGMVLAFDIENGSTLARPKAIQMSRTQANPPWMIGCPMFVGKEIVGIVIKKDKKLELVGQEDLTRIFPEAFSETSAGETYHEEDAGKLKKAVSLEEEGTFNPEKIVTLVYVQDVE
ncbi:MAG: hypothetical protein ACOY3I_06680 [Verrucomicrobiota bacterium]